MIPFPLMTIWMWFQILEASPNSGFRTATVDDRQQR